MDIGGNNTEEWAPSPLVSQLGSDIDGILDNKSENIGGDNEHILDKKDFFWQHLYINPPWIKELWAHIGPFFQKKWSEMIIQKDNMAKLFVCKAQPIEAHVQN